MKKRVLLLAPLLIACGPFFYQAPPPLEKYPHRVAGKSWERLLEEAKPSREDAAKAEQTLRAAMKLADVLSLLPVERRQAKIEELIERNRDGQFSAKAATLLLELQELAGHGGLDEEPGRYMEWRLQAIERKRVLPPGKRWDWDQEDVRRAEEQYRKDLAAEEEWLEAGKLTSSPFFQPNYEVQRAARLMDNGRFDDALKGFRDLMQSAPQHPRAEVACFMLGRCLLEQSRSLLKQSMKAEALKVQLPDLRAKSEAAFKDYLRQYPQGRFVADAHGWLGGVAADQGLWAEAVSHQMDRLAVRESREIFASVLRECDWLFAELFRDPTAASDPETLARSLPWRAMAAHPPVVRLFVSQALDPAAREKINAGDNYTSDGWTVNVLTDRIIRPQEFARHSLKLLGEAVAVSGKADTLSLTVLGWSALRSGESAQAVGLFEKALERDRNDELLQGYAAALTATGRHGDAMKAYAELGRNYPESPLAGTVAFDAALARYHAGEAGEALLQLIPLAQHSWDDSENGSLYAEHEPIQWLDTIAQFAPLDQLAKPLAAMAPEDSRATLLRAVLRYRALADGRFDLARQFLDPAPPPADADHTDAFLSIAATNWTEFVPMDQARWDLEVQPLAEISSKLAAAPDDAALHLEAGKLWQALRGKVTLPMHRLFDYSQSEPDKLDLLRRQNAAYLGLPASEVTAALDARDELNHALAHFLKAAEHSKDPAIAAPALECANEALRCLGEFSRYHGKRAMENDHGALSAKLVARLKQDFPDRPEAARAVTWSFAEPAADEPWMPGGGSHWRISNRMFQEITARPDSDDWYSPGDEAALDEIRSIRNLLPGIGDREDLDMVGFKDELATLRKSFDAARAGANQDTILTVVDHLDDLASVAEAPGITPDLFRRYATMRLKGGAPPAAEGEWLPLKPWLAFYELARPKQNPFEDQQTPKTSPEAWEAYLREFPDGPKTEAAALRVLRAKVREACPVPQVRRASFPEAPLLRGYSRMVWKAEAGAEELEKLRQAIANHQQRFPNGRYQADVLMLRAGVCLAGPHPEEGLNDLATVLAEREHPELHVDAALHLAWFGMRLLEPEKRLEVAAALRKSPAVMPYLHNLAEGKTFVRRLKPLLAWVEKK